MADCRRDFCANSRVRSSVALLLPDLPIGAHGVQSGFSGLVQPLFFLLVEMTENRFARGRSAEIDVGGFPPHGVQHAEFDVGAAQKK